MDGWVWERTGQDAALAAGARSYAMIGGDANGTTSADRMRGFTERLLEAGIRRSDIIEEDGHSSYEGGAAAALTIFRDRSRPPPDALFGVNDIMCMGAIDALKHRLGMRIPDDLMVGGFDDIPEARRMPYQLTTVRQPINQMVEETLAILNLKDPNEPIPRGIDRPISGRLIWRHTIPVRPAQLVNATAGG